LNKVVILDLFPHTKSILAW